jgi:hypothetical protein
VSGPAQIGRVFFLAYDLKERRDVLLEFIASEQDDGGGAEAGAGGAVEGERDRSEACRQRRLPWAAVGLPKLVSPSAEHRFGHCVVAKSRRVIRIANPRTGGAR